MPTIAIIGANGMLGAGITDYLHTRDFNLIEINRVETSNYSSSRHIRFDAARSHVEELVSQLPRDSIVINCAGVIKHKIDPSTPSSIDEAIRVNSVFPLALSSACREKSISIIQIATDCVYSGKTGNYSELSNKDPQDIYGLTKSAGEITSENTMTLRCSLIGRERSSQVEFLEWVLSHPHGSRVNGFTNHFWNGVTVLDIAKFVEGSVLQNFFNSGIHHFVPSDFVSKHDLIREVCSNFDRDDLEVVEIEAAEAVNRVLTTSNPELNSQIWRLAQYNQVPAVSDLLANYALWMKKNG
jgi:dTDP-4-dehydrorhamnose reductase